MARMVKCGLMFDYLDYALVIARVIAKTCSRWRLTWVGEYDSG